MTIIHLIRSLKYLEMEAYYCGAFAVHYWLHSFLKDHFYSNYSKASSYKALATRPCRCTLSICVQKNLRFMDLCSKDLKLHSF